MKYNAVHAWEVLGSPSYLTAAPTAWMATPVVNGTAATQLQLMMYPASLAEASAADAYQANLSLALLYETGDARNITVKVSAEVTAEASGAQSVWGTLLGQGPCAAVRAPSNLTIVQGHSATVGFTACDVDGLALAHENPSADLLDTRAFEASFAPLAYR